MRLNIKKVKPMFNQVVTTMETYKEDIIENGVITDKVKGSIKEYQKIVAIGDGVRGINIGDVVVINPARYAKLKHEKGGMKDGVITDNMILGYNFNTVNLEGIPHLIIYDNDIKYILEEYEELENSNIVVEKNKIITA